MTTARSTSPRLHQIRERFPSNIVTVSTGTAERTPTAHATSGSMMIPAPNPATPPTTEATSAPKTRTTQPIGSGMSCHHTAMSLWIAAAGALLVSLDSMMNIAFPAIATAFAAPPERVRWVIVCYVLTYAITSFAGGAAADRLGHVVVFRTGVGLSVIAFVMGGTAGGFGRLLVARVVPGVAGGLVYGTPPAPDAARHGDRGPARRPPRRPRRFARARAGGAPDRGRRAHSPWPRRRGDATRLGGARPFRRRVRARIFRGPQHGDHHGGVSPGPAGGGGRPDVPGPHARGRRGRHGAGRDRRRPHRERGVPRGVHRVGPGGGARRRHRRARRARRAAFPAIGGRQTVSDAGRYTAWRRWRAGLR